MISQTLKLCALDFVRAQATFDVEGRNNAGLEVNDVILTKAREPQGIYYFRTELKEELVDPISGLPTTISLDEIDKDVFIMIDTNKIGDVKAYDVLIDKVSTYSLNRSTDRKIYLGLLNTDQGVKSRSNSWSHIHKSKDQTHFIQEKSNLKGA